MLKPIGDKILVEFKKVEAPSGILLPEGIKSKITDETAVVLAIGTDEDIKVKPGDEVVFNPHAALLVTIQEKEYILLTQKAILCVTNFDREGR